MPGSRGRDWPERQDFGVAYPLIVRIEERIERGLALLEVEQRIHERGAHHALRVLALDGLIDPAEVDHVRVGGEPRPISKSPACGSWTR